MVNSPDGLSEIAQKIKDGTRLVAIHGQLASGKSIFCEQIAHKLDQTFDVYFVERKAESLSAELDNLIRTAKRRLVLIFEGYERYFDEIEFSLRQYDTLVSVLATTRTSLHTSRWPSLKRKTGMAAAPEVNANRLDNTEVLQLARVLNLDEFRSAVLDDTRRHDTTTLITKDCNNEIRDVLLKLLESPTIVSKIKEEYSKLYLTGAEEDSILTCFVMRVLDINLRLYEIADGFCSDRINDDFWERDGVASFVRPDDEGYLKCSPALAQFFARDVFDAQTTRLKLERIAKKLFQLRGDRDYSDYFASSLKFGRIRELFKRRDQKSEAAAFYDEMKGSNIADSIPYFWLQYSIARWSDLDWGLSRQYLTRAREVGRSNSGFRSFQLDNFDAKMRMEAILQHVATGNDLTTDLRFARKIFDAQKNDPETRDHPLRLLKSILSVLEMCGARISGAALTEGRAIAREAEVSIDDLVCTEMHTNLAYQIRLQARRASAAMSRR